MRRTCVLVCGLALTSACSSGGGSSFREITAKVLMGASTTPSTGQVGQPLKAISQAAVGTGQWILSPDKARVTFTRVDLINEQGGNGPEGSGVLENCVAEYDRSHSSGTVLLDCPTKVAPGTYSAIYIYFSPTVQVLIDDQVNNIYTDPASATKLSRTRPAGGGQYVDYTVGTNDGQITAHTYLPQPIDVLAESGSSADAGLSGVAPALGIVTDLIHTIGANGDATGDMEFQANQGARPVEVLATISGTGHSAFYSSAGSSLNVFGSETGVRVFYADETTPAVVTIGYVQGCNDGNSPSGAFNTSPETSPSTGTDLEMGGYLGRDSTGKISWALPVDPQWTTYKAVYVLDEKTVLGETTTLRCQATASPPAPTSGDTYASGAPSMTPTTQQTLTLVAD